MEMLTSTETIVRGVEFGVVYFHSVSSGSGEVAVHINLLDARTRQYCIYICLILIFSVKRTEF